MKNISVYLVVLCAFIMVGCSTDPMETFNQAVESADRQNWAQATKFGKVAAEKSPSVLTESFYAVCLIKTAKEADALVILDKLAKENPNEVTIQYLYGKTLFEEGKVAKSYNYLNQAYKLDRTNKDCLSLLFQAAIKLNKPEVGKLFYTKIRKDSELGKNGVLLNNYGVWLYGKEKSESSPFFMAAATKDPKNAEIIRNKAVSLDRRGSTDSKYYRHALNAYEKYLHLTKNRPEEHLDVMDRKNDIVKYLNAN